MQIAIFAGLVWSAAQAEQVNPSLAFEAASIRPSRLTPGCFSMLPPGGTQYALTCVTLRNLIQMAYGTTYINGGGGAIDNYYDLRAKTPDGTPWTSDTVRPMLRQLLMDRFHLKTHAGKRELSGYGLFVVRNGSKLHTVAPESITQGQKSGAPSQNFVTPGHVQGRGLKPEGIASLLSVVAHAPVVDHTGLSGLFNIDVSYAPADSTDPSLPSFFTALEEQLGLRLRPEKVIVDTLVIDHADDKPTPN